MLIELDFNAGRQFFGQTFAQLVDVDLVRRHKVNSVGIDLDHLRALPIQPVDHLFQQIAPDLRDARGGVEIGKVSLGKTEVAVVTVDQNLECVLQGMKMPLLLWLWRGAHLRFRFETKRAQISQQMAKDLQLVGHGKAIELQHDRRIKRGDVTMPDVARNTGEKDVGVAAFEAAYHRHFRNGMALPKIFA